MILRTRPLARRLVVVCGLVCAAPLPWILSEDAAVRDGRRDVKAAIASADAEKLDAALASLTRSGGASSMKLILDLLEKMPASEDSLYWSLIGGAVSLRDRPAMDELGKFVVARKSQPIARDLLYGLAKNSSPHIVVPLRPLLTDAPQEMRLLVAKKVSRIRSSEAVDALIELLKAEEKLKPDTPTPLALVAVDGLTKITRQSFGPNSINWEGWWNRNRAKPLPTGKEDESVAQSGTAVDFIKLSPDRERQEAYIGVEQAPLKSVVVLSAKFTKKTKRDLNNDHMQDVLESFHIPHTVVNREDFHSFDLKDTGVLLVNCAQFNEFCICPNCKPGGAVNNRLQQCTGCNKHENFSGKLSGEDVQKIASFVQAGGYLFCEDWTVKEVVERGFPKFVAAGPKLKSGMADVMPARGQGTHPYLKGIFEPKFIEAPPAIAAAEAAAPPPEEEKVGTTVVVPAQPTEEGAVGEEVGGPVRVKHTWKIDNESFSFKIMDKSRVTTFLTSGSLQKQVGPEAGAVAVAFRPGSTNIPPGTRVVPKGTPGVVTVVLSHFGKQESSDDERSIQNLLLNVLIEANAARETRNPKKLDAKADKAAKKDGKDAKEEKAADEGKKKP